MRFIALPDLHQHDDSPIWNLAIMLHGDRDAATLRYRPASRAQSLRMNLYDIATRVGRRLPAAALRTPRSSMMSAHGWV